MTASPETWRSRWPGGRGWWLAAVVAFIALAAAAAFIALAARPARYVTHATSAPGLTPMTDISSACAGQNAEVEEATAAPDYVYADWIGCGGIGFARSADGGLHWSPPVTVPGSTSAPGSGAASWDPAIAVAPDGTVYVSYMHRNGPGRQPGTSTYPVVAASFDHGQSFPQVSADLPPQAGNWGDRDFIAVSRSGTVYLTWDYGPSYRDVKLLCSPTGSCAYSNGDFNAVIQKSTDGGKTWGPITHIEPGFPLGGGYGALLVARPSGLVDVLYIGHPTSSGTLAIHPGWEYFTSSPDGTTWPPRPLKLWPGRGTLSLTEWWIDGDIAADAAGDLYATWDTQTSSGDIGWLTWSRDGGRTWSRPVRVTPDHDNAPHVVEAAGGPPGVAYVAWQTSAPAQGYATYLRPFSIRSGWLGPAIQVSSHYGNHTIWPGDTFGISPLTGSPGRISFTWGSAVGSSRDSEIYAADVILPPSS
ncbi:MAG TPA: sialidase family protein [Trebonia sp.]